VLDEWATRCSSHGIRNPAGYLFGIIQRAIHGEFNAWAKKDAPYGTRAAEMRRPPPAPPPSQPQGKPVPPEVAKQHIERLTQPACQQVSGPAWRCSGCRWLPVELSPGDSSTNGYDIEPLHARPRSPAAGSALSALIRACSVPWRSMELSPGDSSRRMHPPRLEPGTGGFRFC